MWVKYIDGLCASWKYIEFEDFKFCTGMGFRETEMKSRPTRLISKPRRDRNVETVGLDIVSIQRSAMHTSLKSG